MYVKVQCILKFFYLLNQIFEIKIRKVEIELRIMKLISDLNSGERLIYYKISSTYKKILKKKEKKHKIPFKKLKLTFINSLDS